jgi:hypothetical protein
LLAKALKNRATTIVKKRREIETTAVRPFFVIVCGSLTRPFDNFAERCFCLGVWPRRRTHMRLLCASETTMVLVISGMILPAPQSRYLAPIGDSPAARENHLRRITQHPAREVPSHPAGRLGRREKRAVAREGRLIRGPSWQCRA